MCSFEYCHLLELYVKGAVLFQTCIPQSFITGNISNVTWVDVCVYVCACVRVCACVYQILASFSSLWAAVTLCT